MNKIKKIFVLITTVLSFSMGSCIQYVDMHDDPLAYDVEIFLSQYEIGVIKGNILPDDISTSNEGFIMSSQKTMGSYMLEYDGSQVDSSSLIQKHQGFLVPIAWDILDINPKTITIHLWMDDSSENIISYKKP